MNHLDGLEHRSIHILREAYASFKHLCMLWSIGKDSTVLLWHARRAYERDPNTEPFTGVIVGARADEEGSRSKERYFSPRTPQNLWDVGDQPPEFWNQYKTDFAPGTHVRIHPLLDWTELNVWEYIKREGIPTVSLYYDQGSGTRYRSLGCGPCQAPIHSTARDADEILVELRS